MLDVQEWARQEPYTFMSCYDINVTDTEVTVRLHHSDYDLLGTIWSNGDRLFCIFGGDQPSNAHSLLAEKNRLVREFLEGCPEYKINIESRIIEIPLSGSSYVTLQVTSNYDIVVNVFQPDCDTTVRVRNLAALKSSVTITK